MIEILTCIFTGITALGVALMFLPLYIDWRNHRRKFEITCYTEEHLVESPDIVVEITNPNLERTLRIREARIDYIDLSNEFQWMKVVPIPKEEQSLVPGEKRELRIAFTEMVVDEVKDLKLWNFSCEDDRFIRYTVNLYPYMEGAYTDGEKLYYNGRSY